MKSRKKVKIIIIAVITLIIAGVCIFAIKDRESRRRPSFEAIIVDQKSNSYLVFYVPGYRLNNVFRTRVSEEIRNYEKLQQNKDLIGRKIKIYFGGPTKGLGIEGLPSYVRMKDYELGEKASDEEMKVAQDYYDTEYSSYKENPEDPE